MQVDKTDTTVELEHGKYRFGVRSTDGSVYCLRSGKPWVEFGTMPGAKALIGLVHAAAERDKLIEALEFYADPETYHEVAAVPLVGEWAEDFSSDHGDPKYKRPMPGAKAREVLRSLLW